MQLFYSRLHYQPDADDKKSSLHEVLYRIDFPNSNNGKVMHDSDKFHLSALEDSTSLGR